jgi:hypothetical protein
MLQSSNVGSEVNLLFFLREQESESYSKVVLCVAILSAGFRHIDPSLNATQLYSLFSQVDRRRLSVSAGDAQGSSAALARSLSWCDRG